MDVSDSVHSAPPHAALRSKMLVKLTMFSDNIERELVVLATTVLSEKVPLVMDDELLYMFKLLQKHTAGRWWARTA